MAGDCSSNRSDDAGQGQTVQCGMQLLPLGPACTNSTPLRLSKHASRHPSSVWFVACDFAQRIVQCATARTVLGQVQEEHDKPALPLP